jgi:8-oxo-dGTP pyrophosphatase MutT (NUDIX family)
MVLTQAKVREAEARFGMPREIELAALLDNREMDTVARSLRRLRTHDVTFFIVDQGRVAVIRKPTFPADVFRVPSGGVDEGESLEDGVLREAYEETGLRVALDRYLLRVHATFRPLEPWAGDLPEAVRDDEDPQAFRWWTHVFSVRLEGNRELDPKDTREIAEAKWVGLEELQGGIRMALLRTGKGLFRYRVDLTDAAVAQLRRIETVPAVATAKGQG